jgi:hypothetical protein
MDQRDQHGLQGLDLVLRKLDFVFFFSPALTATQMQVTSGTGQGLPINIFVQGSPMSSLQTFSYALPEVSELKASPLGTFELRKIRC